MKNIEWNEVRDRIYKLIDTLIYTHIVSTQKDFAQLIGKTPNALNNVLRREGAIRLELIKDISDKANANIDYLLYGKEPMLTNNNTTNITNNGNMANTGSSMTNPTSFNIKGNNYHGESGSMYELKVTIAEKESEIKSLRSEIEQKDILIKELRERINDYKVFMGKP